MGQLQVLDDQISIAEADQAFEDATQEEMVRVVTQAIEQGETFMNKQTALDSKCGFAIREVNGPIRIENRERKKQGKDPLPKLDANCWANAVKAFDTKLGIFLSKTAEDGKERRAASDRVLSACCEVLKVPNPGTDIKQNYRDELCTRLAQNP